MSNPWTTPSKILSDNRKCGASIDLPIQGHCTPTKNCAATCYAKVGFQAFPNSRRKQLWVSEYMAQANLTALIKECKSHESIRLNGSGDLKVEHTINVIRLARSCPDTMFWGMTRKISIAEQLNGREYNLKILVSVDSSSPASVWNDYRGHLCYGPRLATDTVPDDDRIITVFPTHKQGKVKDNIPTHIKDCPAVRHEVEGCLSCNRCSSW